MKWFIVLFYTMFFSTPLLAVYGFDIQVTGSEHSALFYWYIGLFMLHGVYSAAENLILLGD